MKRGFFLILINILVIMRHKVFLAILFSVFCITQAQTGVDNYMVTAGLGPGTHGTLGVMSFAIRSGNSIISARGSATADLTYAGGVPLFVNFAEKNVADVGLLMGMIDKKSFFYISGALGLSYVSVSSKVVITPVTTDGAPGKSEVYTVNKSAMGLPFEVQMMANAYALGVGVYIYGDLNFESSYGGAALCIQLGKLL
jgi:hypothetical protein